MSDLTPEKSYTNALIKELEEECRILSKKINTEILTPEQRCQLEMALAKEASLIEMEEYKIQAALDKQKEEYDERERQKEQVHLAEKKAIEEQFLERDKKYQKKKKHVNHK